jgi:RNA polymerase sigma-70 factor (ECF subfamily)
VTVAAAACDVLALVTHDAAASAPAPTLADRLARDIDEAFPDLVRTFADTVFSLALRCVDRRGDAEDLAAETFLKAYSALRRYPPSKVRGLAVRPWLVTILLNHWRNEVRAASRRPRNVPLADANDPPVTTPPPDVTAVGMDTARRLAALLDRLPDKQRLAVTLRHVGELSYAEVGAVLDVPEPTARSHVARGLRTLRELATAAGLQEVL